MSYGIDYYKEVYLTEFKYTPMRKRQILLEVNRDVFSEEDEYIEQLLATSDFKEANLIIKYIKEFAR
jgi:hypothetical protein